MNSSEHSVAFGAHGITPRWTSSAKEGLGTAYHTSCRVWFTLSHGIVNEIYYPTVDQPNTRDFQFLISDGETFCHEEKRDLDHRIEYPERDCRFYRLTNSERGGRYRLIKYVLTDPHRSVVLVHTKVEVFGESLRGKLHLYALLALHIARQGAGNSSRCSEVGGNKLFHAARTNVHRSLIADALLAHRIRTEDIMSLTRRQVHTLTPFARVRGTAITYPAKNQRSSQKKSLLKRSRQQRTEKTN